MPYILFYIVLNDRKKNVVEFVIIIFYLFIFIADTELSNTSWNNVMQWIQVYIEKDKFLLILWTDSRIICVAKQPLNTTYYGHVRHALWVGKGFTPIARLLPETVGLCSKKNYYVGHTPFV